MVLALAVGRVEAGHGVGRRGRDDVLEILGVGEAIELLITVVVSFGLVVSERGDIVRLHVEDVFALELGIGIGGELHLTLLLEGTPVVGAGAVLSLDLGRLIHTRAGFAILKQGRRVLVPLRARAKGCAARWKSDGIVRVGYSKVTIQWGKERWYDQPYTSNRRRPIRCLPLSWS
jgi:hypothetical protein